jgi:hypothetical protein
MFDDPYNRDNVYHACEKKAPVSNQDLLERNKLWWDAVNRAPNWKDNIEVHWWHTNANQIIGVFYFRDKNYACGWLSGASGANHDAVSDEVLSTACKGLPMVRMGESANIEADVITYYSAVGINFEATLDINNFSRLIETVDAAIVRWHELDRTNYNMYHQYNDSILHQIQYEDGITDDVPAEIIDDDFALPESAQVVGNVDWSFDDVDFVEKVILTTRFIQDNNNGKDPTYGMDNEMRQFFYDNKEAIINYALYAPIGPITAMELYLKAVPPGQTGFKFNAHAYMGYFGLIGLHLPIYHVIDVDYTVSSRIWQQGFCIIKPVIPFPIKSEVLYFESHPAGRTIKEWHVPVYIYPLRPNVAFITDVLSILSLPEIGNPESAYGDISTTMYGTFSQSAKILNFRDLNIDYVGYIESYVKYLIKRKKLNTAKQLVKIATIASQGIVM